MSPEARERSFDELARGLAENSISRRQAIRWAGYSVAGAALSSLGFAETAEALTRRQRRRCRRKGGTPLEKGSCHCAFNCGDPASQFVCGSNPNCLCMQTTEGTGFCASAFGACDAIGTCSSSSQCPRGTKCVIDVCCGTPVCFPVCQG
jgi:hypothetical protein